MRRKKLICALPQGLGAVPETPSRTKVRSRDLLIKSMFVVAMATGSATAVGAETYVAQLNGFEEIGALNNATGAILSGGTGHLVLNVNKNGTAATYTLTYSGLGTDVAQAHIHFGKIHVAGGIMVFLCTNLGNGPAGTPACPNGPGGTVTGTLTAASVRPIASQNVAAGDFGAVLAALRSNTAYANIHTVQFGAGEIRGQVVVPRDDEDEDEQ